MIMSSSDTACIFKNRFLYKIAFLVPLLYFISRVHIELLSSSSQAHIEILNFQSLLRTDVVVR